MAASLKDYLSRHTEIESTLVKQGECKFYTTEQQDKFAKNASVFLADKVTAETISYK